MSSAELPTQPPPPLDRRLVFVTGKGGTGKSTVATALGMVAARHGRRTIVAEVARRDDVRRSLGVAAEADDADDFAELRLAPNLYTISIDPELAMEEYLIDQLPMRALAQRLSSSRTFGYFAAATPGLRELLAIGKVWELAQPSRRTPGARSYDLVIVDAPATGHGLALLKAPGTFAAAAAVGPIARQAATIQSMIVDPARTAVVVVAEPAEAAVAEALAARDGLHDELGLDVARLIVNLVEARRFSARDVERIDELQALLDGNAPTAVTAALDAARSAHVRSNAQQTQLARLRRSWDRREDVLTLPALFTPEIGAGELLELSHLLQARLGRGRP